ncbi:MAG: type II 3-dehydroquinate dehydratase [Clostridia bacterium]|nr:type II 3-dehydroquinate dehydratase [Clostridia bacterium]
MKILVINGPNLNMLGIREPAHYGRETYADLVKKIQNHCEEKGIGVTLYQSNHEGDLVDKIQEAYGTADGIVINPGAYTHTSIALLDAVKSVNIPTVEVHISKVEEREDFRQISYIRLACVKTITGHGTDGYLEAIDFLSEEYGHDGDLSAL